jgi:4-amino-4-deoxy-L-arabinose transferase-like glycosyltransferase
MAGKIFQPRRLPEATEVKAMQFDRSFWWLLAIGVALRCVAINQPLVDAHLLRQGMTAAATRDLIDEAGFHLSASVPWVGDISQRYVQEFPLYNFLVMAVHRVTGNLDLSGKLTSILLWAASFWVLQFIWRRVLDRQQTFWANLLFVIAPLNVFFGQAFMPEMLIQLLALGFIAAAIRYYEEATLVRWITCAAIGLLGLLIKVPEFAHLYIVLLALILLREGMRALWRPRYLIAAAATLIAIVGWSHYIDAVSADALAFGSAQDKLFVYTGSLGGRLHIVPWIMICLYLGVFVVPGPAALITLYGLWVFVREKRERILEWWLLSSAAFYLVWFGTAGTSQSYYNMPAVAPLCALFGIGMTRLLEMPLVLRWRRLAEILALFLTVVPAAPIWKYLFTQDRQILAAAKWVRQNTLPNDVILFRPNHSSAMMDYPWNPLLAYYGRRKTFVWTGKTPGLYRSAALERATYAVVTLSKAPPPSGVLGMINRFRHFDRPPDSVDWLENNGFRPLAKDKDFVVYSRKTS